MIVFQIYIFTVFSFLCDAGYFLDGSSTSTCNDDDDGDAQGVWSSAAPTCVPIVCLPPHENPSDGQVECSNDNFLDSNCRCVVRQNEFINPTFVKGKLQDDAIKPIKTSFAKQISPPFN